jgi:hypothetical protein
VKEPIEQDDPDQSAQTVGPSMREVRKRWAESGNVDELLNLIRDTPWCLISVNEQLGNLQRAYEVRAKSDPAGLSREIYSRMIGFNAFLLERSQLYIHERIVGRGDFPSTATIADFSIDVVERLLPRLLDMQRAMCEVLAAQAATARLWALTRAKEAKLEQEVTADRNGPRRARSSNKKPARSGTHGGNAKAEVARDGVLPLPARVRGRG